MNTTFTSRLTSTPAGQLWIGRIDRINQTIPPVVPATCSLLLGIIQTMEMPIALWRLLMVVWFVFSTLVLISAITSAIAIPGIRRAVPSADLSSELIKQAIRGAKRSIDILDSYLDGLGPLQPSLESALLATDRSVAVRILLFDPKGHLASARGVYPPTTIAHSVGATCSRLKAFKRQVARQSPAAAARLNWGVFDRLVPGPMFIVDGRAVFAGTFMQVKGSQHTPQIELRTGRVFGLFNRSLVEPYVTTFEDCWETRAGTAGGLDDNAAES